MDIQNFSPAFLDLLSQQAEQVTRQRQHINIHHNYSDPCQRLFNSIGINSYIRPHRHSIDPKDECLIAVRGRMALLVFNDIGQVDQVVKFGTQDNDAKQAIGVGVNLSGGVWHTVIAEMPGSILFEVKSGPFNPDQAKEWPAWAPAENTQDAVEYLIKLKRSVSFAI